MYPRPFEYLAAQSLDDAIRELSNSDYGKVLSGGMSLIPMMKLRLLSPDLVVDIGRVEGLGGINDTGTGVEVGALVRHAETAVSPMLPEALRNAAAWTGDVQVRNRGTTCGALAHADMAADQTAAVLALGGVMLVRGQDGAREIPAEEFFVDALTSALGPAEVLVAVRIPRTEGGSAYRKLGRRGGHADFAVAGAAAWVEMTDGVVSDARVALTGVGLRAELARVTADALVGTDGSPVAVENAASLVDQDVPMIEDLFGSVEYKAHLGKVMARRAILAAVEAA